MNREQRKRIKKKARRRDEQRFHADERRAELEMKAAELLQRQAVEIAELRATVDRQRESLRGIIFGAFLGAALGEEKKFTEVWVENSPEYFEAFKEQPWMALSVY